MFTYVRERVFFFTGAYCLVVFDWVYQTQQEFKVPIFVLVLNKLLYLPTLSHLQVLAMGVYGLWASFFIDSSVVHVISSYKLKIPQGHHLLVLIKFLIYNIFFFFNLFVIFQEFYMIICKRGVSQCFNSLFLCVLITFDL